MAIVVSQEITESVREVIKVLDDNTITNKKEVLDDLLKPIIDAQYAPPRTKPNIRNILPVLLEGFLNENVDKIYLARYVSTFIKREFPEVFNTWNINHTNKESKDTTWVKKSSGQGPTENLHPRPHKRNKDKYNKETRHLKKFEENKHVKKGSRQP